jgi:hypothetical protein
MNLNHVIMGIERVLGSREPKATLRHFLLFLTNPSQETKSSTEDKLVLESDKFIITTGYSTNTPKFKGVEYVDSL